MMIQQRLTIFGDTQKNTQSFIRKKNYTQTYLHQIASNIQMKIEMSTTFAIFSRQQTMINGDCNYFNILLSSVDRRSCVLNSCTDRVESPDICARFLPLVFNLNHIIKMPNMVKIHIELKLLIRALKMIPTCL